MKARVKAWQAVINPDTVRSHDEVEITYLTPLQKYDGRNTFLINLAERPVEGRKDYKTDL